jgi:DNA-binding transcriptional LysR family regulator
VVDALAEIASATADLTRVNEQDRLNLWCVPGFASQWLMSRLGGFRSANPDLDIEFHPTDVPPDFARHEADADLRYVISAKIGETPPGVRSLEIARPLVFPVASPQLLASLGPILRPEDLVGAPLLHEDSDEEWRGWFAANHVEPSTRLTGPRLWHAHLTLDAARRGEGVALANAFLLGDDIEAGRLTPLEVGQPVVLGSYMLFTRKDRWNAPAVVRFRRWMQTLTVAAQQAA